MSWKLGPEDIYGQKQPQLDAKKYPKLIFLEYSPKMVIHYHRELGFID